MNIAQYVKSLLPSIGKGTVLDDVRLVKGELKDVVIPAYKQGGELLKNWKFKSVEVQQLAKTFQHLAKQTRGNMVMSIESMLPEALATIEEVEQLIEASFNDEVAATGLTYLKAQLLQYVEAAGFFAKFSRRLLNFIYVHETAEYVEESDGLAYVVKDHMVPAEISYVLDNFQSFVVAYNALSHNAGDVRKMLMEIPDIVVTAENAETLPHTVGRAKLDPAGFGLIPVKMNPIFHIQMLWAEYQVECYKEAQQDLARLQMQMLNLKKIQEGQPSASLQKQIEYEESRIQGLRQKIDNMEKKYA